MRFDDGFFSDRGPGRKITKRRAKCRSFKPAIQTQAVFERKRYRRELSATKSK